MKKDLLWGMLLSAVVASCVSLAVMGLVGNNQSDPELSGTRFPNGISADSTSPSAGEVRGTTLTLTGASTLSGALTVSGETSVQGFTQGGGCVASTTLAATETWSEAFMLSGNCFEYSGQNNAAAITITLPATSTMTSLLPNAGDTRQWFYSPADYAAATTTTFAAGTGIILMEPDGQNVVIAGATSAATLECIRKANTDVVCTVDEVIDAD